jgi:hypothetical protein
MPQFSRRTILAAADVFGNLGHAAVTRFMLEHGLEDANVAGSLQDRSNALGRYLLQDPARLDQDGRNLVDTVVSDLVNHSIARCQEHYSGTFDYQRFRDNYPPLHRGLERDGFTVESGQLRRALPEAIDLPQADDEVHRLLERHGFNTPRGHLDQAIAAHARGDWAAANAQFRPFVESLFDDIAERLGRAMATVPAPGHARRQFLAQLKPPFFFQDLNEWTGQGTGFLEGFYRRLHPQGAHPGLSDEQDSTFRLHLVLLVARLLLTRFDQRTP